MTSTQKKAVIFAPFWRQKDHVGNNRVDRFVRWLAETGYKVVMIRAGSADGERQEFWGREITVRDPMGLYRDTIPGPATHVSPRKPNKLRRALAYWLFNPDPTIIWARAAARHTLALQAMQGATFILSSSPPESAHVGAWLLSRRIGVPHIVDMRDGWLDEPLKPLLLTSTFRRWKERRLERRILHDSTAILVSSDTWQMLLSGRYPSLTSKIHVLTNGYPQHTMASQPFPPKKPDDELVLIHAGRFLGSRLTQSPDLLLTPLLRNLSNHPATGVVQLIGPLSNNELKIIEPFKTLFRAIGWRIECPGTIPRSELLDLLPKAEGLLLLSASHAALPSKIFEYIPTGRPLFVVTEKGSATWNLCESLPQATMIDIATNIAGSAGNEKNCFYEKTSFSVPDDYSEHELSLQFTRFVKS